MRRLPHEWPLAAFGTLAIAGAGTLACWPLAARWWPPLVAAPAGRSPFDSVAGGAALLGLAIGVSAWHLGKPWRAGLAVGRTGASALSNEVAACGLALALALGALVAPPDSQAASVARWAAALASVVVLVTIGLVYRLAGQHAWGGAAIAAPLAAGLAFGAVAAELAAPVRIGSPSAAAMALVAVDLGVTLARWRRVATLPPPLMAVHPRAFARRHLVFGLRVLLFDAAPALLLAGGQAGAASAAMAAGLALDRGAFYALGVRRTIESETAGAEEIIACMGGRQ